MNAHALQSVFGVFLPHSPDVRNVVRDSQRLPFRVYPGSTPLLRRPAVVSLSLTFPAFFKNSLLPYYPYYFFFF